LAWLQRQADLGDALMGKLLLLLLGLFLTNVPVCAQQAPASTSFIDKMFGKSADFPELKRQRRALNSEITRGERDVRSLEAQIDLLSKDLEESPQMLIRMEQEVRLIDEVLQTKEREKAVTPGRTAQGSFRGEREYFLSLSTEELKSRKADREQRRKEISDKTARLGTLKEEARKKRDDLDAKQAALVDLEDRIGSSLNVGDKQYVYRTLVSGIFAIIVFYLVSRFFGVIQEDEDVKKKIFAGDAGIQFITLFSIVIAVILFGILEILGANELSALLGGLSGYILGKTNHTT